MHQISLDRHAVSAISEGVTTDIFDRFPLLKYALQNVAYPADQCAESRAQSEIISCLGDGETLRSWRPASVVSDQHIVVKHSMATY